MRKFDFRGLEFHSTRMWQWWQAEKALDLMSDIGMNALIFHDNDLIDELVLPSKYFSDELMLNRWPVRLHTVENNRHYINKVIREAKERGIDFYVQVKEIWYHEGILELVPELRNPDGTICVSNPFWWEFLEQKVSELVEIVPDIAGVIVSPGTRESKVSISTNKCKCDRCKETEPLDWYSNLINAMYRPLAKKGKTLVVRDFAYSADQQSFMLKAASKCSNDIVIALKNTPHDYYPTFPDNPEIGNVGEHPQWIEFDAWGQFFGLGFFPVSVVEDMKYRMQFAYDKGATGAFLRTDWEAITEASNFNSLNLLNVFSGALISNDLDIDLDKVYQKWAEYGVLSASQSGSSFQKPAAVTDAKAQDKLKEFMKASWAVMEKAVYVRGHVFHEDCMFPDSVQRAFYEMVDVHTMDHWKPGASKLVEPNEENIKLIFEEKEKAVKEVKLLPSILQAETLGLPEELAKELNEMLDLYDFYVRGFKYCTHTCFLTRKACVTRDEADIKAAKETLSPLDLYRKELIERLKGTCYPHYTYWLLDEQRIGLLLKDAEKLLADVENKC